MANDREPTDLEWLDGIAKDLIGRGVITHKDLKASVEFGRYTVEFNLSWDGTVEQLALSEMSDRSPEDLLRVIKAIPDTDLFSVHGCAWLDRHDSGLELMTKIAATTLVYRVRQLVYEQREQCQEKTDRATIDAA